MLIATFRVTCQQCGRSWSEPHLGDFAYGSFIARGDDMSARFYFDALSDPGFQRLDELAAGLSARGESDTSFVQWATGELLDAQDGSPLSIVGPIACCDCGPRHVVVYDNDRTGEIELSQISVDRFTTLSRSDQESIVRELWDRHRLQSAV